MTNLENKIKMPVDGGDDTGPQEFHPTAMMTFFGVFAFLFVGFLVFFLVRGHFHNSGLWFNLALSILWVLQLWRSPMVIDGDEFYSRTLFGRSKAKDLSSMVGVEKKSSDFVLHFANGSKHKVHSSSMLPKTRRRFEKALLEIIEANQGAKKSGDRSSDPVA